MNGCSILSVTKLPMIGSSVVQFTGGIYRNKNCAVNKPRWRLSWDQSTHSTLLKKQKTKFIMNIFCKRRFDWLMRWLRAQLRYLWCPLRIRLGFHAIGGTLSNFSAILFTITVENDGLENFKGKKERESWHSTLLNQPLHTINQSIAAHNQSINHCTQWINQPLHTMNESIHYTQSINQPLHTINQTINCNQSINQWTQNCI